MKKFRFQLDTVLNYKQQALDSRLLEHATAIEQVNQQNRALASVHNRLGSYNTEYCMKKASGLTVVQALEYQGGIQALEREVKRETEKLGRLKRIEEEKRAQVVESRKETATLERLRELKQEKYASEVQKEEETRIDDLMAAKRLMSNA